MSHPGPQIFFAFLIVIFSKNHAIQAASAIEPLVFQIKITDSGEGMLENLYEHSLEEKFPPELLQKLFNLKKQKNKKLIAALLSFPFPFGIVGLHRIYLGTSPHVPLVYIGTLGGGFGLIPLIDFFVILFTKDIDSYINNNKVFMWIN